MSEKKVTKKKEASKSSEKDTKKKKAAVKSSPSRNEKGQFTKGQSGNPGGRPKISEDFKKYAEKSPAELWAIVQDPDTGTSIRTSILMWFAEMYYGKARQQVDVDANQNMVATTEIEFKGVLGEWAQ